MYRVSIEFYSINLLESYHEFRPLIGYAIDHVLFDRNTVHTRKLKELVNYDYQSASSLCSRYNYA